MVMCTRDARMNVMWHAIKSAPCLHLLTYYLAEKQIFIIFVITNSSDNELDVDYTACLDWFFDRRSVIKIFNVDTSYVFP